MSFCSSKQLFRLNDLHVVFVVLFTAGFAAGQAVPPQAISQSALQQIADLTAEKEARSPAQQKLDSHLHYAGLAARGRRISNSVATLPALTDGLDRDALGRVLVDIRANVTTAVLDALQRSGAEIVSSLPGYRAIRASVPVLSLESLAGLQDVDSIRPADRGIHGSMPTLAASSRNKALGARVAKAIQARRLSMRALGLSPFLRPVSQGDVAHGANLVRSTYGFDGTGVKVGVLSDGVDALAALQASGDLPAVNVISGQGGSGNEGSAMLEIVYDLAPGAELYFATARLGTAQMAANIIALRQAGCDIIIDDWTYFAEAVFQDGDIAKAVNTVSAGGALYFSSAQNSGNLDSAQSGTWEGDFVDSGTTLPGIPAGYAIHSFNGTNHDLITANSSTGFLSIKWSDPLGGSANDYDFYLLNTALTAVVSASTNVQNGRQDPFEFVSSASAFGQGLNIVIVKRPGAADRALHVDTERGRLQINTDGATFGHNAGVSTVTVAAVNVARAGGNLFVGGSANPVETYSSDGPRRIFYNPDGTPITPGNFLFSTSGGTLLQKDDIAAADCANGHAPGFTTFCGTSAAAPHAGAIAALVKSGFPGLTAAQILSAMKSTALDIMTPGIDRDSGSGLVMANRAVAALTISASITSPANGAVISGNSVPVIVSTSGSVAGVQLQVDGNNVGASSATPPFTIALDTTALTNGPHTLVVIASNGLTSAPSPPVNIVVSNNSGGVPLSFITGQTPGAVRNDFSGFAGMAFTVGSNPIVLSSLGRIYLAGNGGSHTLKLVRASNGIDVPGGSASLDLSGGGTPNTFQFAPLASPVTLQANTRYFLLSLESAGGDTWYDFGPVTGTSAAIVNAPAYQDVSGTYNTLNPPGQSYVPVSFTYCAAAAFSLTITSPASGATVSGSNVPVTVSTAGVVTSVQLQVDGNNVGSPSTTAPFTTLIDTTALSNGPHTLVAVASDGQTSTASPFISFIVTGSPSGGATAFITGQTPGPVRNDFSGFAGMAFTVGSSPLTIKSLGRLYLTGNAGTHTLKLVQASNGADVPGGSVSLALAGGGAANTYKYAALANPITLQPNTMYLLLSLEVAGGDTWYDFGPVTSTADAVVNAPAYQDDSGNYDTLNPLGQSYVPVSFTYSPGTSFSAAITSPSNGAEITGNVQVAISTAGTVASVQLQIDGNNVGSPSTAAPFSIALDTSSLTNGPHTLVAVASDGQISFSSPFISVIVINSPMATTTAFITGQTIGPVRNNFTGFVGMAFTTGSDPLTVNSLGRLYLEGNTAAHTVKLVDASSGVDVPGGFVSLSLAGGGTANTYKYAALGSSVTLQANTKYYLLSLETSGGDTWYDFGPVTSTGIAVVNTPAYQDTAGKYNTLNPLGQSYVPVTFTYSTP